MFMLPNFLWSLETDNTCLPSETRGISRISRPLRVSENGMTTAVFHDASIAPGLRVGAGRSGRQHVLTHLRQHTLGPVGIVLLHCVLRRAAGVAVRHAGSVLKSSVGVGVTGGLQLLIEHVNSVVEEICIAIADRDVQLAFELGPEGRPIALHDGREVVVIVPVCENIFVYSAAERTY